MSKNNGKPIPIAQWVIIEQQYKNAGLGLKRNKEKCDHLEIKIAKIPGKRNRVSFNYEETQEYTKWIRPWHSFRVNYQLDSVQKDEEPEEHEPENEPEQAPDLGEEETQRITRVSFFPIMEYQEFEEYRTIHDRHLPNFQIDGIPRRWLDNDGNPIGE